MNDSESTNTRIPIAVCAAVADVLEGSHQTLDELFLAAGAPGPPPGLAHHSKWKTWLHRAGNDPEVDSLAVLGNLIEEFMDLPPPEPEDDDSFWSDEAERFDQYHKKKERLVRVMEEHGFRYFRGGRVLPVGVEPEHDYQMPPRAPAKPSAIEDLLDVVIRGLPRAMHPLAHRRRGATQMSFESEYDIQDLLHSQIRPWISDVRPEEYTPSYAGSSTRMDFLLPEYSIVLEVKRVRDRSHASKVGDELILDIAHYQAHPKCQRLWCVIYDPERLIGNPEGLSNDLSGTQRSDDGAVDVRVFVF